MKKNYFITALVSIVLFTACEGYNERNFPGLEEASRPTNLVTYNYTLTNNDYGAITTEALKTAQNALDTAAANAIKSNMYFTDAIRVGDYAPLLLNKEYKYADAKSAMILTYNLLVPYDTTKISSANKYVLADADYEAMGTGANQPGATHYFSSTIDPAHFISRWLSIAKYPYGQKDEIKLIRYQYKANESIITKSDVFVCDGSGWTKFNPVVEEKAKFVFQESKVWKFIDSDILTSLFEGMDDFTAVNVSGDQVWSWNAGYKYMIMTGYVAGTYNDNEDWLISPPMNFTERTAPWLTFMHVGRYFGDAAGSNEKMRASITIWATTKYDGSNFNAEEWTQLTIPDAGYPNGANWTFIPSTPISLSDYAGKENVRIAFKYLSSAENNAAGTWEIKNLLIYDAQ